MLGFPGLVPVIRGSRKCQRCGLRYPRKAEGCPHCADLDGAELERYLAERSESRESGGSLGWLFLIVAGALVVLVVVVYLG